MLKDFSVPEPDLNKSNILITGGTGSFGRAFVKSVLSKFKPNKLIVFSRDELKQSDMMLEFPASKYPCMRYFLGDIRDLERLKLAVQDVQYVVHAAALKQVPAAEYNPMECIKTNVIGAENIVMASLKAGVSRVISLSTDKAANPINLYGASKLASDKIFIAANNLSGENGCRYSVVRYGNVVGSRGSVIPLIKRLLEEKSDSIPITDPRMTRFWITLDQGVDFVLSCLELMQGGEIFVPKIPSMKTTDLVTALAPAVKQVTTGIRPGEKIHETMITVDDARNTIDMGDRYIIYPAFGSSPEHKGKPVADGFSYASDSNPEQVSPKLLLQMTKA
jgi:UDP-N-acetylglucosamine 4,6-dehydratase